MSKKKPATKKPTKPAVHPAILTARKLVDKWDETGADPSLPLERIFEFVLWSHMPSVALKLILETILTATKQLDHDALVDVLEDEVKIANKEIVASQVFDLVFEATKNEQIASDVTQKARELYS